MSFSARVSNLLLAGGVATLAFYVGRKNGQEQLHQNQNCDKHCLSNVAIFPTLQADNLVQKLPSSNMSRIGQIMQYGFPSLHNIRSMEDYVLSYDTRTRVANWVFEHLTLDSVAYNDAVDRTKCEFREDSSIHAYFRSQNSDYKGSGFDRGHLAAAGNHRRYQTHCDETFFLSNMAPQVGKGFNRDKWNELEMYCRKLVKSHKNVYISTGPLYLPRRENDGKMYVKYQVLGQNHVAVPTHFFKIVVCETENGHFELESFVLPNDVINSSITLSTFLVPIEVVERASGLLFFDKLNKNQFIKINGKKQGWL